MVTRKGFGSRLIERGLAGELGGEVRVEYEPSGVRYPMAESYWEERVVDQQRRRVLIVEDEFLLAMQLEDILTEMGHEVVACVARLDKAMQLADQADIDFAILDVNLHGDRSFPVAANLRRRNIPFIFATGYGSAGLSEQFQNELTLQKPYEAHELQKAITAVCVRVRK